ncbi:L-sorbosone dehydrogenase [Sodiomyces alkalinus F11]|uniref:L-sorbosone dehydrogenase n=1 Tax=Sodiomyces alkalinus (strain CBS 110278 / VKM F-3762 / F11) TaxID=1314773 RepID=A0A3N2PK77_SODAK|nr:L-sorbosone dehydrogenase [Sodiomyces alkalinus F11]ROT34928.1 L-sorbosone dehydrogenase [Sodiomyces alkalinus F11]
MTQSCDNYFTPNYKPPVAADGWTYRLIAQDLARPRSLVIDSRGALLVLEAGNGIKRITLEDNGGTCLAARDETLLVRHSALNHGIAISDDGTTLFASTSDEVFSWSYDAVDGIVSAANRTIVEGMHNSGHTTRSLLMSRKSPGMLVVSRGSDGNIDELCSDESSGHCQVRAFNVTDLVTGAGDGGGQDPLDFTTDGILLGWGLRNSVGIAEDPNEGGIWTVENSVDNLERDGVDIHRDNPAEELNFHGSLEDLVLGVNNGNGRGANYGYPDCLALGSTDDFPQLGDLNPGDHFHAAGFTTLNDSACEGRVSPRLTFQAHTAPLDIKFAPDGSEAFIAFHGSWNRDDPVGYKVSSVAFDRRGSPEVSADSNAAMVDVLSNQDLSDCPAGCFRPVGLAWDDQRRLYVTSDSTGEIFVLQRSSDSGSEASPSPTSTPDAAPAMGFPNMWVSLVALAIPMVMPLAAGFRFLAIGA